MPVIKVWCLPKTGEKKLNELHRSIVRAIASIKELGVKDEKDVTCLFPTDMMKYGLGTEIVVEVTGLFDKPDRTHKVRQRLAVSLVKAVQEQFPDTELVECFIYPFNLNQGFWTSRKPVVALYTDYGPKSREAEKLLRDAGAALDIEKALPGNDEIYPTAVHMGQVYRGLEKIRTLCGQISFERRRPS